jgi:predicted ATP-grasp superfamily ATP-dependent carboligase
MNLLKRYFETMSGVDNVLKDKEYYLLRVNDQNICILVY